MSLNCGMQALYLWLSCLAAWGILVSEQWSNLGPFHCKANSSPLDHQGSPKGFTILDCHTSMFSSSVCVFKQCACLCVSISVVPDSLRPLGPTRLLCPWISPGKNTGVGCRSLLQGIFPTQGSNLSLLHCRHTLYHLSHQINPLKQSPLYKCKKVESSRGWSQAKQIFLWHACLPFLKTSSHSKLHPLHHY